MRSSAIITLFAASAIAGSVHHKHHHAKKDLIVETDLDIVYTTVWVTEGVQTPTSSPAPAAPATTIATSSAEAAATSVASQVNLAKAKPQQIAQPGSAPAAAAPQPAPSAAAPAPVSSSSQASSNSAPSTGSYSTDPYKNAVLVHHNVHRQNHSSPDIEWDDSLASIAYDEASVCKYAHNVTGGGGGYGQNIAAGVHSDNVSTILTDMFYNAEMPLYANYYGMDNPDFTEFEKYGHFTQMVWAESTKVGCATVDCSASGLSGVGSDVAPYFTVCNYGPAGNMGGEYGKNIGKPSGKATVTWNYLNAE